MRAGRGKGLSLLCTKPEWVQFPSLVRVIQLHEPYGYPHMRHGRASFASVLMLALLLAGEVARASGPEPVEFREGDITLKAVVYRPEGAGPFPAVIAMHDCSGLTNASG